MTEQNTYEHSGKFSLPGVLIAFGLGVLTAIVMAFIYNFLIVLIPIIYLNFFITVGFGVAIGYSVKYFSRFGKIRNKTYIISLAAAVGFVAFYFQWIAYFVFLSYDDLSFEAYSDHLSIIFNPLYLASLIIELNVVGSWSIFGLMFNGMPLWLIWISEAAIIIGMPVLIMKKHPVKPYSELLQKWYNQYKLNYQFERISMVNQFKEDLGKDVENTVNNLSYGESNRYSEVMIYFLEDEEQQYLSVNTIYIEDQGKGKKKSTPVVHLIKVNTNMANSLMSKHGKKRVHFD